MTNNHKKSMLCPPYVVLETGSLEEVSLYEHPLDVLTAHTAQEVSSVLADLQQAHEKGYHLAGYSAFELGYVLEPCLRPLFRQPDGPLICFGIFQNPPRPFSLPVSVPPCSLPSLSPLWSYTDYVERFQEVQRALRAGDVYQINLTFPLYGHFSGDPFILYQALRRQQSTSYGGLLNLLPQETLLSFSPELFFEIKGGTIRACPMKGTMTRGHTPLEDLTLASTLQNSEKARAENLMIVDLLRNDIGRIAVLDSVKVPELFTVETYPTLHQMTSSVIANLKSNLSLSDIIQALFPAGSVVGAPKLKALEWIHALEPYQRSAYCGMIGAIHPTGEMRFNVAIRTLTVHKDGTCHYPVGSGVVLDSNPEEEYAECLLKARLMRENKT